MFLAPEPTQFFAACSAIALLLALTPWLPTMDPA